MANDIGGVWRTIGGRRVFIKDGQDLASAMKESGKFKKKENNSRTQYYNDIQNAKTEDDLQRILAEHDSVRTNTREESKRFMKEWAERAKEIRSNVDEKTRNLEDGKEIHDVYRQMDAKEMEAFAKQNPESIKKMQDYLKNKEDSSAKEVNGVKLLTPRDKEKGTYIEDLINQYNKLVEKGDTNYKTLQSLKKEIAERRKTFSNTDDLMTGEKTNIKSDDKRLLSQIQEETDSYAYKELLGEYNAGKVTTADLEDTLKTLKQFNGNNEDKISAKQFKEASKIDEPLERAIQMQVADDVGKTLNDDDIRFRAENYIKNNYKGEASTEEIYEKLKSAYKNNGTYDNNNDDYEYNLYKQAKENPDSINAMTEWSTDWEDLDKRFKDRYAKENSKYKYSVDGQKITEAEFKAEYDKQKKLGNIDKDMTYDDYKQGIVDDRNSNVRSLKNDLTADERLQYLKEHNKFVKENQKNDLMTAEQLKGKDREEQKEINKQYLKEQNKLAKEKGLISDYNKTDSRGSMSDDSFIEQARKNGMSDEQIAKEVYKKHNGPESNNTSDNNIKRLLAKQAKEEAIAKGDKKRAETFENYEKNFAEREKNKEDDNQFTMYNSQYDKEVTVKKGADGKWVDSDGNKYMGYLSKQDVKQYFKGNWKESTEKRTASEIISSQMSKTKNAKIEVANALGLKYDNDNEWKSTSQLYKEQKGKDIVNMAIDSGKADKYNAFVNKNYNHNDKNFSDRADIDKYAKDNNLDADALYYMTKVASESDRTKLKKKAFELETQKAQEHSNKMNAKVNTPVTQLSDLRDRFYKAKSDRENNQIREYTKSALGAVKEGTTLGLVVKESTAGWTSMGGWHDENTTVKKYTKIGPNKWDTPYGVKTDEDMVLTALYNNEPLRDLQEANDIAGIKSMSDKSSFRYYGNSGPNRVTYKNQSSNNAMNNNIRNAYEEYKKKHPRSKINFSKFKDNYKS